jgi:DMSO/TMAO reductase YedYZ molybdopterin-dependent catalytic subunit/thiosulfate reductase cytochrome b subunit
MDDLFPLWLRIAHFINIFCLIILARSGIQILFDHPRLYWKDNSKPGTQWARFSRKKVATDRIWTSMDDADSVNSVVALPGGFHNLGAGRNWHFVTAMVWSISGLIYVGLLFWSGRWQALIPTDAHVFSAALETLGYYLRFQVPPMSHFQPYDALQQLTYSAVVFIVAPIMIITGLIQSPGLIARFPWLLKPFGNQRQAARSLHFLGLVTLGLFTVVHVTMVLVVYFPHNIKNITFGTQQVDLSAAIFVGILALLVILLFNIWATITTILHQRAVQNVLTKVVEPVSKNVFGRLPSRQAYTKKDITDYFWVNGPPPTAQDDYKTLADNNFKGYTLSVSGLVTNQLQLTLDDLKAMPRQDQITKHFCIQGWTAVGHWAGVPLTEIIKRCQPTAKAKYVLIEAYDIRPESVPYYETIEMDDAQDSQTILAYEFNYKPLPLEYGAPLRLRCEKKLGYKMVKFIKAIRFIEDFEDEWDGKGGYREDKQFFDRIASI